MQRRFATRSHVTHECFGGDSGIGSAIGVCSSRDKAFHNCLEAPVSALAQGSVQRRFAGPGQRLVHICAKLDQAIDEPDVAVENGAVEVEIVAHLSCRSACTDQGANGGSVAVIGAPLQKRKTIRIHMRRVTASIQMSDNLVGAPVLNCA